MGLNQKLSMIRLPVVLRFIGFGYQILDGGTEGARP